MFLWLRVTILVCVAMVMIAAGGVLKEPWDRHTLVDLMLIGALLYAVGIIHRLRKLVTQPDR